MIVCPNCRHVNHEGQQFCTGCGRSLEPGPSTFLPARRTEAQRPPVEIHTPKPPSKARPAVVAGILVAALAAGGAFLLFRPDPCKGTNFASDNFGYCLMVPEGWTAEQARFGGDVTLDQFSLPKEAATVIVEAVDLTSGTQLDMWVDFVRQKDEDAGLTPGPSSDTRVDGVEAQQWDVSVLSDGGTEYLMREVAVVLDDVGWRITLNDVSDSFDHNAAFFDRMLESWRFR